jgi:hypothetical protein
MTTEKAVAKVEPRAVGITKEYAVYLLKTIWPLAPDPEVVKAALICARYGLDPLLKEVSLIKFDKRKWNPQTRQREKVGEDWVAVLGIKANRKIASNHGARRYSYIDGPRVMTEKEQKEILGEVEPARIWAITKIQDQQGNAYPGYGFWPKEVEVYGDDKGNSARNMAFIRSERNALDRMAPGELPDIEVADESFVEVKVDQKTLDQGKADLIAQGELDIEDLFGPAPEKPPQQEDLCKTQDEPIPQTLPDLLTWVAKHGKQFSPSWMYKEVGKQSSDLQTPEAVKMAWLELKDIHQW